MGCIVSGPSKTIFQQLVVINKKEEFSYVKQKQNKTILFSQNFLVQILLRTKKRKKRFSIRKKKNDKTKVYQFADKQLFFYSMPYTVTQFTEILVIDQNKLEH